MAAPNYYDLSGDSIRVAWYPQGTGGPVKPQPARGPVLEYTDVSGTQTFSGANLTVADSPVGTFVTAIVKKNNIVPGGVTAFAMLVPDAIVGGPESSQSVTIHAVGVLSIHRGTAQLGSGQLESYTTIPLSGTAASIVVPALTSTPATAGLNG